MPAHASRPFPELRPQVAAIAARGDPEYDQRRAEVIWNRRLANSRAPAAIIRCTSPEQIIACLAAARRDGLQVSLRGSGHSYIASPLQNNVLLLDLGGINQVTLDLPNQSVIAGPGVRGGELLRVLAHHGLAFPVGHCDDVALGGYLLAGGLGWNSGAWGPACNLIEAVDLILADGSMVRASEQQHPDLFWAARGSGSGFFAVVTAYHLRLQPMPLAAWVWNGTFCASAAEQLAPWLDRAIASANSGVELACQIGPNPSTGQATITVRAIGIGDDYATARAEISDFETPPEDARMIDPPESRPVGFADLPAQSQMPSGKRVAADHCWSDHPLGVIMLALRDVATIPDAPSSVNLVVQGAHGRIPCMPDAQNTALSVGGGVSAGIYAMWDHAEDDARHCDWVRQVDRILAPFSSGRYVGEADLCADPGRPASCFSPPAWNRLARLRARYDPGGLFYGFPPSEG